jgi:hypothetical protein
MRERERERERKRATSKKRKKLGKKYEENTSAEKNIKSEKKYVGSPGIITY